MRNRYGMKRPFDIGTFPKVDRLAVENYNSISEVGFYAVVETVEPLSYDDIDNFELCVLDDNDNVIYKYGDRKERA